MHINGTAFYHTERQIDYLSYDSNLSLVTGSLKNSFCALESQRISDRHATIQSH